MLPSSCLVAEALVFLSVTRLESWGTINHNNFLFVYITLSLYIILHLLGKINMHLYVRVRTIIISNRTVDC